MFCIPESCFDSFIENNPKNAVVKLRTMAKQMSMFNINMSMLIDELSATGSSEAVENDAVKDLAEKYSHYYQKILPMILDMKI